MSDAALNDNSDKQLALDFAALRSHGIELIQRMCGDVWTDFNLHDPGVTILEQLCYAITDLAYQSDFNITDLLADKDGSINYEANSFFKKQNIFTSNPVTINDYRKAIIDEVKETDNVWLIPLLPTNDTNTIRGLYTIVVQVNKIFAKQWLAGEADPATVSASVLKAYSSKRNLCEDIFNDIVVLKPVEVAIHADIQIEANLVPEQVLANIYLTLENNINKPVKHFTELELSKRGFTVDEMYCGPFLRNGLIPDSELSPRQKTLDSTNIASAISAVPGVVLVKTLTIERMHSAEPVKILELADSEFAFLNIENLSSISINLFVDKYRVPPIRKTMFGDLLQKVIENEYRDFVKSFYRSGTDLTGTYRNTSEYYSIQNYFPFIYGIGEEGLFSSVPEERKAQAKQLKAYLMLFEQILANYQSQLDNIDTFFTNDLTKADNQTYFANTLYNIPRVKELLISYDMVKDEQEQAESKRKGWKFNETNWKQFKSDKNNGYMQALKANIESDADFEDRKNRILDHLLARFNETVVVYPVKLYNLLYRNSQQPGRVSNEIRWKASILKDFHKINYNRARAFDYLKENDTGYNFESKMRKLLYINNDGTEPLTNIFEKINIKFKKPEHYKNVYYRDEKTDTEVDWSPELQKIVLSKKDVSDLIDNGLLAGAESSEKDAFVYRQQNISVLKHGININHYRIGPDPFQEEDSLVLYKAPDAERWTILTRIKNAGTPAISTIKKLVSNLVTLSTKSEGFYVVEHILLRPSVNSKAYGFKLYRDDNQVIFEHNRLLTFGEREQIVAKLLKFSPGDDFYLAQQIAELAAANKQIHHTKWADRAQDFVKKADALLKQASHLAANAIVLADKAGAEDVAIAERNKYLATQNEIIAALNLDIANQFLTIRNKSKVEPGVILTHADKTKLESELKVLIDSYYADVKDLLDKANHIEDLAKQQSTTVNNAIMSEISQMGKLINHTGNVYTDIVSLYSLLNQYGQQLYPRFKMLVHVKDNEMINEDFFSFNMTVILPEWPARFQDKSFMASAEGLLKYHAPAHINLHIKWFGLNKMKRFEELFFEWRKSLITGKVEDTHDLVRFLAGHLDNSHSA
ncbi:hypothetical protein BEL04_02215 [Mucilaginibacter sp. PPCGB 2223]|uniref:hypothetical protein n=1 Tax=Mucilaginibacter sp. PPCGB 2223 TaxID=1886027 RepID=UPI00082555E9|nr:hypothetical protein [Mucilaginibacter sp. PPCGB 2223]OCX53152.1 hypothetical protein BEL04_02215 [Mucilaginibacter sp. PPCGB 2223]